MKKILVLMLLSLSLLNPIYCMEEKTKTKLSGLESLPPEMWQKAFAIIIEDHFNSCNDVFDLYSFDKNLELRKTLARIKLVSKSFFTFNKKELEKFITQTRDNRLDYFTNYIKTQYADLSQEELNNQLRRLLEDMPESNKSETKEDLKKSVALILAGANINLQVQYGWTALILASKYGYTKTVRLLLGHNANTNLKTRVGDFTALTLAIEYRSTEIVQLLLDHNTDTNAQTDIFGRTALMLAAEKGYIEIARLLLDHNANADLQDSNGQTALTIATKKGHTEIAQLLRNQSGQNKNT